MFGWLARLFGGGLFGGFTLAEKRDLCDRNVLLLEAERSRRRGQNVQVVDTTGAHELVKRLSDAELDRLIEIRELMTKADRASGMGAVALYKKVARLAPWDEVVVMSIGVEYAHAENFPEALRWLEKAAAMNPGNARVRRNLDGVRAAARGR